MNFENSYKKGLEENLAKKKSSTWLGDGIVDYFCFVMQAF